MSYTHLLFGPITVEPIQELIGGHPPVGDYYQTVGLRVTADGRSYDVRRTDGDPEYATLYRFDHIDAWLLQVHGLQRVDGSVVQTRLAISFPDRDHPFGDPLLPLEPVRPEVLT